MISRTTSVFVHTCIVALALVTSTLALGAPGVASASSTAVKEKLAELKTRQAVDSAGPMYAEKLSPLFIYLHRNGADLKESSSLNWLPSSRYNPFQARFLLWRGWFNEPSFQSSVKAWLLLLRSPTLIENLNSSPQFWNAINQISRREGFDLRIPIRRELAGMNFTAQALPVLAAGLASGGASALLRAYGYVRTAIGLNVGMTAAAASYVIWTFADGDSSDNGAAAPQTSSEARTQAASASEKSELEAKHLDELNRRAAVLKMAGRFAVVSGLSTTATPDQIVGREAELTTYAAANAGYIEELNRILPGLRKYRAKLKDDTLPIKVADDDAEIRTQVSLAVEFVVNIGEVLNH